MAISANEQTEAREAKKLPQSYTLGKVADLTLKLSLIPELMLLTTLWDTILDSDNLVVHTMEATPEDTHLQKIQANAYLNSE